MSPRATDPFLDAALHYAGAGFPVFPLRPRDKIPLIPKADGGRGVHDATINRDTITAWWARCPTANVGLAMGQAFWALDVDGQEGAHSLDELERRHGPLPLGPASRTGNGGLHLLFAADERVRNSVRRLGPGLDTRSTGGYITAPPSIHPDTGRRYVWWPSRNPSAPLPAAPVWLIDLLDPPRSERPREPEPRQYRDADAYVRAAIEEELRAVANATKGCRNHTLNRAAFVLGRFTVTGELDANDLRDALINAAELCGLDPQEVERTVDSALRAAARRPS